MFQNNSRISTDNRITFYEQDILYDNYIYTGDCSIELNIDYLNNGFGIVFIDATSNNLTKTNACLLFKMNHRSLEIIYKENDLQKNLGTFNSIYSVTCTENLKIKLIKVNNSYSIEIGSQKVTSLITDYEFNNYYIGYYSNKNNVINNISISSSIPYGWVVNMEHTNGGYIDFHRDGFELINCNGIAELEQILIPLNRGIYYLNYEKSIDSDIKAFVLLSDAKELIDDEKNILHGNFINMPNNGHVSIKFKGTHGAIKNISLTSSEYGGYIRTSPDFENIRVEEGSNIHLNLEYIKEFEFIATISFVPDDHYIVSNNTIDYLLNDIGLAVNIPYHYKFINNKLIIKNPAGMEVYSIRIKTNELDLFYNINAIITDFIITDLNGETTNITIENTIKDSIPGIIKSPIIIVDENNEPLDLSSSYRYYYKNNNKHYVFTNTEREYFEPSLSIFLEDRPIDKDGSVTVYGIKKYADFDLDKLLEIRNPDIDTLECCCNAYDIIYEEDLRYINKATGEIRFENVSEYKYIVVDYLKNNSYCLNYMYELNSYLLDISVVDDKEFTMIYDDKKINVKDLEFINNTQYYNTNIIPSVGGYLVIGGAYN